MILLYSFFHNAMAKVTPQDCEASLMSVWDLPKRLRSDGLRGVFAHSNRWGSQKCWIPGGSCLFVWLWNGWLHLRMPNTCFHPWRGFFWRSSPWAPDQLLLHSGGPVTDALGIYYGERNLVAETNIDFLKWLQFCSWSGYFCSKSWILIALNRMKSLGRWIVSTSQNSHRLEGIYP